MRRFFGLLCCLFFDDHHGVSDGSWGGYGWTCKYCGKNDFSIHDM